MNKFLSSLSTSQSKATEAPEQAKAHPLPKKPPISLNIMMVCATLFVISFFGIKIEVNLPQQIDHKHDITLQGGKYSKDIDITIHHKNY